MRAPRFLSVLFLTLGLVIGLCGCVHLPSASQLPGAPKVGQSATGSPAKKAIQTAVNYTATLSILGGLACLAFGGLAIYGGQLLPGIKLVIAGLLLPVFGIYWAYHWLAIVIILLISTAAIWLTTHYALIRPALVSIEAWAKTVEARLAPAAKAPAAASAPVSVTHTIVPAAPVSVASIFAAIHAPPAK
jgi:hypothetical protein